MHFLCKPVIQGSCFKDYVHILVVFANNGVEWCYPRHPKDARDPNKRNDSRLRFQLPRTVNPLERTDIEPIMPSKNAEHEADEVLQAVILADSFNKRFKPLTTDRPKV